MSSTNSKSQLFGVRRLVAAFACGCSTPQPQLVATGQSADKSAHSKALMLAGLESCELVPLTNDDKTDAPGLPQRTFPGTSRRLFRERSTHLRRLPDLRLTQSRARATRLARQEAVAPAN